MASRAISQGHSERASRTPLDHVKRISLVAALAALFNETAINNVMAATFLTVAAPMTAGAFIYEVTTLRNVQLAHEEVDRAEYNHAVASEATPPPATSHTDQIVVPPPPRMDISHRLDVMLSSRSNILDTFGDDPRTVAPIYVRIIKQMLKDDDTVLASLAERQDSAASDAATLSVKETQLRALHVKLAHLAGA